MKELLEIIAKALVDNPEKATTESPYNPFFAIISSPVSYSTLNGKTVEANEIDIVSRLLFMLHTHKAYPITGTVCTTAASMIPGSIVHRLMRKESMDATMMKIGHPSGIIDADKHWHLDEAGNVVIEKIAVGRTARTIMDGTVYIKKQDAKYE